MKYKHKCLKYLPLLFLTGCSIFKPTIQGCVISDEVLQVSPPVVAPDPKNQRVIAGYIIDLKEDNKILRAKLETVRESCQTQKK